MLERVPPWYAFENYGQLWYNNYEDEVIASFFKKNLKFLYIFLVFSRGGRIFYFIQNVRVDLPTEKPLKREGLVSPAKHLSGWRFHAEDTEAATSLSHQLPCSCDLPGKY